MYQANLDLGVFQDTKLGDGVHTLISASYHIFATDAPIWHRVGGGGGVLYLGVALASKLMHYSRMGQMC